jgi:hypothetical protein
MYNSSDGQMAIVVNLYLWKKKINILHFMITIYINNNSMILGEPLGNIPET